MSHRALLYPLIVSFVTALAAALGAIMYAAHVARETEQRVLEANRESDRQWCDIVTTFDDTYRVTPPTTETGKRIAASFRQMRVSFGCE